MKHYAYCSKGRSLIWDSGGPASTSGTKNLHHSLKWRYLLRLQRHLVKKFRHKTANLQCEAYSTEKHNSEVDRLTEYLLLKLFDWSIIGSQHSQYSSDCSNIIKQYTPIPHHHWTIHIMFNDWKYDLRGESIVNSHVLDSWFIGIIFIYIYIDIHIL